MVGEWRLISAGRRLLREPLLHFLLVGIILFAASEHHRRTQDLYRIEVSPERVAALEAAYHSDYGTFPDSGTRERAIEAWLDDEMLYREGLARGLDKDDEIVRRRVVQKIRFLSRDLEATASIDETTLRRWFDVRKTDYARPAAVDFAHVFFADPDNGEQRAREVLAALPDRMVTAAERGDPFPDAGQFTSMTPGVAQRLFGNSELAHRLFAAPVGQWDGPFRSAYGWHLVRVSARADPFLPDFEQVRQRVADDYAAASAEAAERRALERLRTKFIVVRADQG